jgi:PhnB protein
MAIQGSEPQFGVIVPHLVVADVDEAVRFYQEAFSAVELYRSPSASGVGQHVHLRVYASLVFLSTEEPAERANRVDMSHLAAPETLGGSTCVFQVRVDDVDTIYERSIGAGATPVLSPCDMFWGDRYAWVRDPSGHVWALCAVQHVFSQAEVASRMQGRDARGGDPQ